MAAIKKPCWNYQAKEDGKDYGLTAAEIRPIWEYAKKRYLDNGLSYEETIDALVRESKKPARFFAEVIAGPKSARVKNVDVYRREDARREAKRQAQQFITNADQSGLYKTLYSVGQFPRAALTALHGGVFPVTHAGGVLLRPLSWLQFWRGFRISWGTAHIGKFGRERARAFYESERLKLYGADRYAPWRQAGLRIGVDERAQGILSGWLASGPGWSKYSWLGLMRMRYELAEQMLKRSGWKTEEEMLSKMKGIAEIANHSTGVSSIQVFGPTLSKGMFAPQLTTSKLLRVTHDPIVTIRDIYRMMDNRGYLVDAGARAAIRHRLQNATEMLSFWMGALYLNDAMLNHAGSKQRINWSDMAKSDWLRFKSGNGLVFATRGPEEFLRLYGQLAAVAFTHNKRAIHGKNPWDEWMDRISQVALYKGSPGFQTIGELAAGEDMFGRPLPEFIQKARGMVGLPKRYPTAGKPQMSLAEYTSTHLPIFLTGGAREIYDSMRQRGLSPTDSEVLLNASLITAMEFAGFGGYHEEPHITGHKGTRPSAPPQ